MTQPLVVIPTFNEADNIVSLLEKVLSLAPQFDILIVDDSSPDGTSDLVRRHADPRVHLLQRKKKMGLGTAYMEGFSWALSHDYPWICQMDADFSHDPEDLVRLVHATEYADLVLGSRYMLGGRTQGWALHRNILSRMANIYARVVTRVPFRDLTGGFRCYRKVALEKLLQHSVRAEGYAFQIETAVRVFRRGLRMIEIPITFREREKGTSKISRRVVWEAFWVVLRLGLR